MYARAVQSGLPLSSRWSLFGGELSLQVLLQNFRKSWVLTQQAAQSFRYRSLHLSAFFLALSGIVSVLWITSWGAASTADLIPLRILAYAAWLYGALGLSAFLRAGPGHVHTLLSLRGVPPASHSTLRALGIGARLTLGMSFAALPGLLTTLFLAPQASIFWARLCVFGASTLYLSSLSFILAALGVTSERLAPRFPRLLTALIVLGPYFLSFIYPGTPSLPGFYAAWLDLLVQWKALEG